MKKTLLHGLLALLAGFFSAGVVAEEYPPTRVLFIGNSYLYYNDSLHNHVKRMVAERYPMLRSRDIKYKSATIGGARLKHHNIDWLLAPGQIGVDEPFQAVVMQGGSFEPLTPETRNVFIKTATAYAKKAQSIGAEPWLYMTHAYVAPHRRAAEGMIDRIASMYIEAGKVADAGVIPVGLAFERSYSERPDFALHADFDGTHPNLRGTYLGACVVYLSLYDDDLKGLQYDYFGRLPRVEAVYLQRIAREAVHAFEAREK